MISMSALAILVCVFVAGPVCASTTATPSPSVSATIPTESPTTTATAPTHPAPPPTQALCTDGPFAAYTPPYTQRSPTPDEINVFGTLSNGNVLYHEWNHWAIMQYNPTTFTSSVWAGSESASTPATTATATLANFRLNPRNIEMCTSDRNTWYITDVNLHRIYRVVESANRVLPIIGTGTAGADTGSISTAAISSPRACAVASDGKLYFIDTFNQISRIVRFNPSTAMLSVIAGGTAGAYLDVSSKVAAGSPLGTVRWLILEPGTGNLLFLGGRTNATDSAEFQPRNLVRIGISTGSIEVVRKVRDTEQIISDGTRWVYQLQEDPERGPNGQNNQWYRYDVSDGYAEVALGLGSQTPGDADGSGSTARFNLVYGAAFSPDSKRLWIAHRPRSGAWYPRYIDGFCLNGEDRAAIPVPTNLQGTPSTPAPDSHSTPSTPAPDSHSDNDDSSSGSSNYSGNNGNEAPWITPLVVGVFFVVLFGALVGICYMRKKRAREQQEEQEESEERTPERSEPPAPPPVEERPLPKRGRRAKRPEA